MTQRGRLVVLSIYVMLLIACLGFIVVTGSIGAWGGFLGILGGTISIAGWVWRNRAKKPFPEPGDSP